MKRQRPKTRSKSDRRRPRRRRHSLVWLLESLFCTAFLAGAGYGFYHYLQQTEYLSVQNIRVMGHNRLAGSAIVEASWLSTRDNVLFFDAEAVRQRVEALPYVKTCAVQRGFPDYVTIEVTERVPVASLLVEGECYELDTHGVVLRRIGPYEEHIGPLITLLDWTGSVTPGDRIHSPGAQAALALWDAFSHTAMADDVTVSEIAAYSVDDLRMYCDELRFEIRWGRGDVVEQARNLNILWEKLDYALECQEYLDLRFGRSHLVCK